MASASGMFVVSTGVSLCCRAKAGWIFNIYSLDYSHPPLDEAYRKLSSIKPVGKMPSHNNSSSIDSNTSVNTARSSFSSEVDGQFHSTPSDSDSSSLFQTRELGIDGNDGDSIAICGFSIKFPQDATSPEAFWEMIMEKRCAMTEFPSDRMKKKNDKFPIRGAHFIQDDISIFDASFFSISPAEAAAIDPMQRWLLETAYRALENAGITMEEVSGSSTAVYTGCLSQDYMLQIARDAEFSPTYAALGIGLSMLANRLSWFFNLHGPSVALDSACSSSAIAVDIACQALRNGSCDMSMVAGCNLLFSPDYFTWLSNLGFLSLDGRCYSFDHRANGYARGEGIGVIILKRLQDAIRDGNTIRAVIRSTRSNEDGRTPGITQPSLQAQETLIKETYLKAGLSMAPTRYFEAHGTGTPLGDPLETQAMGLAFRHHRTAFDPLYVGAVKSNIGHLEGASSIASIVKTVLALEKGVIPPNANFEKLNPKIDAKSLALKFPERGIPWPTQGLRRASINSFGYGGANTHIVIDDAYHYLSLRHLSGKHNTLPFPPQILPDGTITTSSHNGVNDFHDHHVPKLLVWSSSDRNGLTRVSQAYESHTTEESKKNHSSFLDNLAYTLDSHRSHFQWRSFAIVESPAELGSLQSRMSSPVQVSSIPPCIGYIFTGQGAQWFAMGRELILYPSFAAGLDQASHYLQGLGCQWSIIDELLKNRETSRIDDSEFSQTVCTVLQVAIVDLLSSFGVEPTAVAGHSSGEIAAAYAGGYISGESAWRLAYLRGLASSELSEHSESEPTGAMMAVGSPEEGVRDLIATINQGAASFGLSIACINSPNSVTVAGEQPLVDQLESHLHKQGILARKLRVKVAYHTRQMNKVSDKYHSMIGPLSERKGCKRVPMISSVTGKRVSETELLDAAYWTLNMVSPVQFSRAVCATCEHPTATSVDTVDYLMEIGPHAALQAPIREILLSLPQGSSIGYGSFLRRGESAMTTALTEMGRLHSMGVRVNLRAVNGSSNGATVSPSLLVDLPEYPFDHSQRYWHETQLSRNYRFAEYPPSELLGVRSREWNPSEARWRHVLKATELPWIEDHVINDTVLYPAAGMIVMALEAFKQLRGDPEDRNGYVLRDVLFLNAMDLTTNSKGLEVQTSLNEIRSTAQDEPFYEFKVQSRIGENNWIVNCRGLIGSESSNGWVANKSNEQPTSPVLHSRNGKPIDAQHMYNFLNKYCGYDYGPQFRLAQNQIYDEELKQVTAEISLFESTTTDEHVVHPTSMDTLFHLPCTVLTNGGTKTIPTSIPTRIDHLWISGKGLARPELKTATARTVVDAEKSRRFSCNGIVFNGADSEDVRLRYHGLELTSLPGSRRAQPSSPKSPYLCMHIDTKPSLEHMNKGELVSLLDKLHPNEQNMTQFYADLDLLVELSLKRLVKSVDASCIDEKDSWRPHYWRWLEYHLAHEVRTRRKTDPVLEVQDTSPSYDEVLDRVKNTNHIGRLYAEVASNLLGIFNGHVNPLELLVYPGFLGNCYDELLSHTCAVKIASYVDLLAHQSPGMNILEVGGGTGSGARRLLKALCASPEDSKGPLRCNRYDFTDVSAAFLDQAKAEFEPFLSQMTFGTLDIERDYVEQGYSTGDYDVVVAVGVLHISSDIAGTLRRVREALKPGGKLIVQEGSIPDGWNVGFIFGLFPGWWFGVDDGRTLSPNISADTWDTLLKENGFSGVELATDFGSDCPYNTGWIVSTATEELPRQNTVLQPSPQITIVIEPTIPEQQAFSKELVATLNSSFSAEPIIRSVEAYTADDQDVASGLVIFLADYKQSYLTTLSETNWESFKRLIRKSRSLLWVNTGGGRDSHPDHGMLDGLARTLRLEHYELHLVTLALDAASPTSNKLSFLTRIAAQMISKGPHEHYEQDYVEIDGLLNTRRLVEARYLTDEIDAKVRPYELVPTTLNNNSRFTLSDDYSGVGHSLGYVEVEAPSKLPSHDDIDISVQAAVLEDRDYSISPGLTKNRSFGRYCSGVVVDAGEKTAFHPGDRVFAVSDSAFHSHLRLSSSEVIPIPVNLSFVDACWAVPLISAAHQVLIGMSRAQSTDSVLIHGGITPIGQAAIQVLTQQGIQDIWVTAANEDESARITNNCGIPSERVLPNTWFDQLSFSFSQFKQRFDIIFSADETSSPSLVIRLVKSGGRYIHNRNGNKSSQSQISGILHSAPANVSISLVDLSETTPSKESLSYGVAHGLSFVPKISKDQIAEFAASSLADAFNSLRSTNDQRPVVITFGNGDIIDIKRPTLLGSRISPEATYLVSGGLGGLGREVATRLVSRGARYLILLSRSGPRTPEAFDLLAKLREDGVHIEAPACDVSDATSLATTIADCSTRMPPIKGCIQASMVMTESLFDRMSFGDWRAAVDPKVRGSWNLHMELPKDLDFFIMFSSVMGIFGTGLLSAYNAGNSYQDALARYRVSQGERAVSIDLSAVADRGYIAENERYKTIFERNKKLAPVMTNEICVLLDVYCNPEDMSSRNFNRCQSVVGVSHPGSWNLEEEAFTMTQPFWGHVHHTPLPASQYQLQDDSADWTKRKRLVDPKISLAAAESTEEAGKIASEALAQQISAVLGTPEDRIDLQKSMQSYGLDSLSAISIRNWISKVFDVDMPVFEMLGGTSFASVGMAIAQKFQGR
ncbi:putative polyketide synthase [Hypoxylon cercidicola]|nr:putative polyketide synthase [Hypoxylon cercidicola]